MQDGDALEPIERLEGSLKIFIGQEEAFETIVTTVPKGEGGPGIAMQLQDRWMIGDLGHLSGQYNIVGQVDQILEAEEELPALRMVDTAPITPFELSLLKAIFPSFVQAAENFGIEVSDSDAVITGPAVWLTPIAIFR